MISKATVACVVFFLATFLRASANTSPYTSGKFQSVIDLAKLQEVTDAEGEEETYLPELRDYASDRYRLMDGDHIEFRIHGSSRRSELRERTSDDENAGWSIVDDSKTMVGSVAIPAQAAGLEEFTFLQVHCDSGALVRLSWVDDYSNDEFACVDCTIANVRQGLGDDDVPKFFLSDRHDTNSMYEVTVENSMLWIWVDGVLMVNGFDVSFWDDEPCYFKAGIYNNHPADDDAEAVVKISGLQW